MLEAAEASCEWWTSVQTIAPMDIPRLEPAVVIKLGTSCSQTASGIPPALPLRENARFVFLHMPVLRSLRAGCLRDGRGFVVDL